MGPLPSVLCQCSRATQNCEFWMLSSGSSVNMSSWSISFSCNATTVLSWSGSRTQFLHTLSRKVSDGTSWVDRWSPSQLVQPLSHREIEASLLNANAICLPQRNLFFYPFLLLHSFAHECRGDPPSRNRPRRFVSRNTLPFCNFRFFFLKKWWVLQTTNPNFCATTVPTWNLKEMPFPPARNHNRGSASCKSRVVGWSVCVCVCVPHLVTGQSAPTLLG